MTKPGEFVAEYIVLAADMNDLPGGVLGYAEVTANETGITALTDLTGLSVTVDVVANRRIRVTGHGQIENAPSGTEDIAVVGFVREGSTTLGRWGSVFNHDIDTALSEIAESSVVLTPSSGSHTYKLSLQRTIGSGAGGIRAAADNPSFILVEDIGPA